MNVLNSPENGVFHGLPRLSNGFRYIYTDLSDRNIYPHIHRCTHSAIVVPKYFSSAIAFHSGKKVNDIEKKKVLYNYETYENNA